MLLELSSGLSLDWLSSNLPRRTHVLMKVDTTGIASETLAF